MPRLLSAALNRELYDIEVEPTEAAVVREVFDMADRFGYDRRRISSELIARGIRNERTWDYGIQIEFNVSEAQYPGGMEMG